MVPPASTAAAADNVPKWLRERPKETAAPRARHPPPIQHVPKVAAPGTLQPGATADNMPRWLQEQQAKQAHQQLLQQRQQQQQLLHHTPSSNASPPLVLPAPPASPSPPPHHVVDTPVTTLDQQPPDDVPPPALRNETDEVGMGSHASGDKHDAAAASTAQSLETLAAQLAELQAFNSQLPQTSLEGRLKRLTG